MTITIEEFTDSDIGHMTNSSKETFRELLEDERDAIMSSIPSRQPRFWEEDLWKDIEEKYARLAVVSRNLKKLASRQPLPLPQPPPPPSPRT